MHTFLERVRRGDVLVGDGAMGTMLMERGLGVGECPESFNLDRLEVIEEVAGLYAEAGADIVTTNTFGGSALNLEQHGLGDQIEEANKQAVHAARRGAAGRAYVSVSCGPCGRILQPYGDTPAERVTKSFRRQLEAALSAGPDLVCVETMIDLEEARLAIQAVRECDLEIPVVATMTFDHTPRGFFTIMGTTVAQAVVGLTDAGADIIGSNCGNGIDRMVEIAEEFRRHTDGPLIIQSNAGLPVNKAGTVVYPEDPAFMAERVERLVEIGVSIIGGCCGTTPEHIGAIRARVDSIRQ